VQSGEQPNLCEITRSVHDARNPVAVQLAAGLAQHGQLAPVRYLEPQVSYAAAVAWQIVERIQPIEMVDREIRNGFRRCKSKIYSHAPASIFPEA
jgi:hypothetical protein